VIDYIGGKRISIRRHPDGIAIRRLATNAQLILDSDEWFELAALITAIVKAVDFDTQYSQGEEGIA